MGHRSRFSIIRTNYRSLLLLPADALALAAATFIALRLRFDDASWADIHAHYPQLRSISMLLAVMGYVGALAAFRLYNRAWRFASLEMLWNIMRANTVGIAGMVVAQSLLDGAPLPRSVVVMTWASSIVLSAGIRIVLRVMAVVRRNSRTSPASERRLKRAVIVGAGTDGALILRAISEDPALRYDVVGFLDDDPKYTGVYINNVRVLGPTAMLGEIASRHTVDEVILALPEDCHHEVHEHLMECRKHKLPVKKVPQLRDTLIGKTAVMLVEFGIEDLLHRQPVETRVPEMGEHIRGRKVLVTGAGGSIGSELCRQILKHDPKRLILLGHGENSIHLIFQELRNALRDADSKLAYVIASVSNRSRVDQVMREHRPDIVFHAAAHKHVPIMESNEQEAVSNNVLGTNYVADACGRYGVKRMVLISTDKAAEPCSIMGATKWMCEQVLRAMAAIHPDTSYMAVRFGNVLGSRGSVVPVFKDQILHGGPVTVTDPEMTRYFMTIPEAVRLVLQAGAVGRSGDLYLLDMGDPVKIVDLARDMILLHGFEPEVDIKIAYTGVRPGEKLHERLTADGERIHRTRWEGLHLVERPAYFETDELLDALEDLERAASRGTAADVRRILGHVIPCQRLEPDYGSEPDDDLAEEEEEIEAHRPSA